MKTTIEDRIRSALASKTRVTITGVKRSKAGFIVMAHDGTATTVPTRKVALALALALARCAPVRFVSVRPVKLKTKSKLNS
jgi:hypothetical protein